MRRFRRVWDETVAWVWVASAGVRMVYRWFTRDFLYRKWVNQLVMAGCAAGAAWCVSIGNWFSVILFALAAMMAFARTVD